jgi:TRIAD3 protein (E3 ubiquitin-protein ligase RNF216)
VFNAMNVAQRNPGRGNGPRPNAAQREQDIIDLTSSDSDMSDSEDEFFEAPAIPQRHAANANPPAAAAQPQQNAAAQQPVADVPPDPMLGPAVWGDYVIDDDFDDEMIARAMDMDFAFQPRDQFQPPPAPEPRQAEALSSSYDPPAMQAAQPMEDKVQVVDTVVAMFPGICRDHVSELYGTISQHSDRLIAHILDKMERGTQYPKAKDKQNILKRKREVDEDEEAARKYTAVDRKVPDAAGGLRQYIRNILSNEFPETPCAFIDATLNQSGYRLFSAYRVLEEAHRTFDPQRPPYNKIKKSRAPNDAYSERNIEMFISTIDVARQQEKADILRELQAARRVRRKADAKRASERQAELEEEANLLRAQEEGTTQECGCCFGDYPLNRMVHCDNDEMHWFCRGCAKRNAETEIGNSKYELNCMSMDGCESGFSHEQRSQFLDENTIVALERNEQEAVLRLAGIENLASCPFCPFAAEYPLVEVDREFRCQAPDCEKISCRLCKLESHIPKSCEENAKDNGLSVRRQIEEAMSAAMIRKCNKCGTPFVKEEGCNKVRLQTLDSSCIIYH